MAQSAAAKPPQALGREQSASAGGEPTITSLALLKSGVQGLHP
jgi:hypothetical protein